MEVPDTEVGRQAVAALRGYAYQVWASALAWAGLSEDEALLLEVADDYSVLTDEALRLSQVKDTAASGSVTLRTRGVIDAINRLWRFQEANPTLTVSLSYLTTSVVGREQGVEFPSGMAGLEYWRATALEGSDVEPLRRFLPTLGLEEDLAEWIRTAAAADLRARLIRPIRWQCAEVPFAQLDILLEEALSRLCGSMGAGGVVIRDLRDGMVADIIRAAVLPVEGDRRLEQRQLVARVRAMAGSALPSLGLGPTSELAALDRLEDHVTSGLAVPRASATAMLSGALVTGRAWLHGPSGIGKSALALTVAASNRPWFTLDLRDQPPAEAARRLRAARRDLLGVVAPGGLIIEDLNLTPAGAVKRELHLLLELLRREDAHALVTAYKPPPPSLVADLGLRAGCIVRAPRFEEAETAAIVRQAGGDPGIWAIPIHLSCGSGYPQLVAARVAGLRQRGWPAGELGTSLAPSADTDDVALEREAVRTRLYSELPSQAASLLYRLTILSGPFDRELALSVAGAATPIAEPGAALDLLAGPWLEMLARGRYRVSPLVSDAGGRVLSDQEKASIHEAVVAGLVRRSTLSVDQLPQVVFSSFITGDRAGFAVIISAALLDPLPPDVLGRALFALALMRTDRPLVRSDAGLNQLLRMAQLKVAIASGLTSLVDATYRRLQLEPSEAAPTEAIQTTSAFLLATAELPLPATTWFPVIRALPADAIAQTGRLMGTSLSVPLDDMAVFLFTFRAYKLTGLNDLGDLLGLLEATPAGRRDVLLKGYFSERRGDVGVRGTLVQSAWLAETKTAGFSAGNAVQRLAAMEDRVAVWPDSGLAVECACARVVMLAEYGGEAEAALEAVEASLRRWPGEVRLRRERGKVLSRLRRFAQVQQEAETMLADAGAGDAVDRAYTTRDVALAAGEMGDMGTAIRLMERAAAATTEMEGLAPLGVRIRADIAIMTWRAGERLPALHAAVSVLKEVEARSDDTKAKADLIRAVAIMAEVFHQDLTEPGWDADISILGSASRVFGDADELPKTPLVAAWYRLAQAEAALGVDVGIDAELEARASGNRLVPYEFIRQTRKAWEGLQSADALTVTRSIIAQAEVGVWSKRRPDEPDGEGPGSEFFEPVDRLPWVGALQASDPLVEEFVVGGALVGFGFAIARGDMDWLTRLKLVAAADQVLQAILRNLPGADEASLPGDFATTMVWSIRRARPPVSDPRELLFASGNVLHWLGQVFLASELAAVLAPLFGERWAEVAEHQTFRLRAPSLTARPILDAAASCGDRRQLARLTLAAYPAVDLVVPPEVLGGWRKLAGPPALALPGYRGPVTLRHGETSV